MKFLIYVVLALGGAIVLTRVAQEDPGYVLISRSPWTVEMSLVLFAVVVVVAFAAAYFVLRSLGGARRVPAALGRWRQGRAQQRALRASVRGYLNLIEGDWTRAEKHLLPTGPVSSGSPPVLNYLAAAYAAQQRGELGKRDRYLARARRGDPDSGLAVDLTEARLRVQSGQSEKAVTILKRLQERAPKNIPALRLLAEVYGELADFEGLLALLPAARKAGAYTMSELDELELRAHRSRLEAAPAGAKDGDALERVWQSLKSSQRRHPRLIAAYAGRLLGEQRMDECETLLRSALRREWHSELAYLYGLVRASNASAQFKTAESWVEGHGSDRDLLLTLGRLAIQNRLWGKARSYLEASIGQGGRPEAYRELGRLLEQLGETDQALECYRNGMERAVPTPLVLSPEATAPHHVRVGN